MTTNAGIAKIVPLEQQDDSEREPWEIAREYLGVKFRHRGRSQHGLDCLGLLVVVAERMGIQVFDKPVYGREPWKDGLRDGIRQHCGEPIEREIQPGDILLIQFYKSEGPSHVAMAAPHPHGIGIIHTYARMGRVVEHRIDEHRFKQIVEAYQWPGKD
jgi:cell wall-associated NlpC family hydrolase